MMTKMYIAHSMHISRCEYYETGQTSATIRHTCDTGCITFLQLCHESTLYHLWCME